MKKLIFAICLLTTATLALAGRPGPHDVKYQNEKGSTLILSKHATGQNQGTLTGTFASTVAPKNCQQEINQAKPIAGFYDGSAITVTAGFPKCHAVVAFVGNVSGKSIDVIWLDAKGAPSEKGHAWERQLIGHDKFHRVS